MAINVTTQINQLHGGDSGGEVIAAAYRPLAVEQARQRDIARTFRQADVVLQEDGHHDGGDQRNQRFELRTA